MNHPLSPPLLLIMIAQIAMCSRTERIAEALEKLERTQARLVPAQFQGKP